MTTPVGHLLMAGSSAAAAFNPAAYGTLFAWYDPSDAATLTTSSGRVDQINDKTGNGRHLTSSGANRPYTGRTQNGLAVLDFQSGQYIRLSAAIGFSMSPWTMFVVQVNDTTTMQNAGILAIHNSTGSDWDNNNAVTFGTSNNSTLVAVTGNSANLYSPAGSGVAPTGTYGFRHQHLSGTNRARTPINTATGGNNSLNGTANGGVLLGTRFSSGAPDTQYFDGAIGEVLIYSTALSDADMDAVYNYLVAKWGA